MREGLLERCSVWASVVMVSMALGAPVAHADSDTRMCLQDSKGEFKDCGAQCTEDFQTAKDNCLNRDHTCVEACRAERSDCRDATGLDAALATCDAATRQGIRQCRLNHPPGEARDQCIDQVQVIGFECREDAREAARPALKACRKQFMSCAHACPPANPPSAVNPGQCREDARAADKQCGADCVETYQVEKDACRHRDHACVEQCRENRHTCERPIRRQLNKDIAQCKATRDAAVANCQLLYPDGDPRQEQCIENAQVADFVCRDNAWENARPGLRSCRQTFLQCAQSCGPGSPSGAFIDGAPAF